MKIIVDDEIQLKSLELHDVEYRYKIIDKNREFLKKWLGWVDFYKGVENLVDYTKMCIEKEKNKEEYTLGIYYKELFVGCISIQSIDYRNKKCEIGYWLSKDVNGKGIMTRSCKAIIVYIYKNMDFNRISILSATENYASQAIPKRLGFVKEGTLIDNEYLYGKYFDNYIYSINRKRWEKNKNM